MNWSCRNCEIRTGICHDTCESYNNERAQHEEQQAGIRRHKESHALTAGHIKRLNEKEKRGTRPINAINTK